MNRLLPGFGLLALVLFSGCSTAGADDAEASDSEVNAATPAALPEACKKADIVSLERPQKSAEPKGPKFTFRVRFRKPASADAVTVVHVPGGPGLPSIGEDPGWIGPQMGLVQTDPRGVGCNPADVKDPASFYRSAEAAEDVIAAIDKLGLKNYVIHGHSYGTALTTRIAHLLSKRNLPKPKAILLEGVLAEAFQEKWMGQAYLDEWDGLMKALPPEVQAELSKESPLGIDGKTWGNAFMTMSAAFGHEATAGALAQLANDDSGKPNEAARQQLASDVKRFGGIQPTTGAGHTLQRFVACREISMEIPDDNIDVVLDKGKLVKSADAGTLCSGLKMDEPYDVKNFAYPFRTFYFLGEHDPATPAWQGKLHFDRLKTAERVELVVAGSGHMIFDALGECMPSLIERAAAGSGFGEALSKCQVAGETRFAKVGE